MAVKLVLKDSGRRDIIDVYKEEMTHGLLLKPTAGTTLGTLYDLTSLIAGSSDGFGRIKQLQLSLGSDTYSINNNLNQSEDNLFSQFVPAGEFVDRVGLYKREGDQYRLNGIFDIPSIHPSVDTPVLINITISIVDNL